MNNKIIKAIKSNKVTTKEIKEKIMKNKIKNKNKNNCSNKNN